MDEALITILVDVAASDAQPSRAALVHHAAEQSVNEAGDDEAISFFMVTTDVQHGRIVKRIEFESAKAAERFEAIVRKHEIGAVTKLDGPRQR